MRELREKKKKHKIVRLVHKIIFYVVVITFLNYVLKFTYAIIAKKYWIISFGYFVLHLIKTWYWLKYQKHNTHVYLEHDHHDNHDHYGRHATDDHFDRDDHHDTKMNITNISLDLVITSRTGDIRAIFQISFVPRKNLT
ncbi:hypothetical protein JTB14_026419 [Gonioctena quinquepunctata]|nr:hypothetical protein JTB14_026419 [Gonioctena quinquepunctata]